MEIEIVANLEISGLCKINKNKLCDIIKDRLYSCRA